MRTRRRTLLPAPWARSLTTCVVLAALGATTLQSPRHFEAQPDWRPARVLAGTEAEAAADAGTPANEGGRNGPDDLGDDAHVKFSSVSAPASAPMPRLDTADVGLGRPYLPSYLPKSVRFAPPIPTVNGDLSTFDSGVQSWDPATGSYKPDGRGVSSVQTNATARFVIEQQVVDTYSMPVLARAIEQFNGVPGSRFRATIAGTTAAGVTAPTEDGTWRIFFDDATCRGGDLAWAHMQRSQYDSAYGARQIAVGELDLGLCRALSSTDLYSTVGHEMLHGAGMSHLCNLGDRCFKAGMSSSNTCRIMYPSARSCQVFAEADTRALAYLHPMVPRMSGPTREQTAARAAFALRSRASADAVVFVDGARSPDLAIQAAAFAAARNAPLLLTSAAVPCTEGAAASELNRVATTSATVWLVGPMPLLCSVDLTLWGLSVRTLDDGAAVADAIMATGGASAASRTLLVTRAAINGDSPDALAAAAVAGRFKGPVLYSQGSQLQASAAQWLAGRRGSGPGQAIVVGGVRAVPDAVVQQLRSYGLDVLRLSGPSRIDTALALARHDPAFGPSRAKVLIAAADRWPDTVTASAVGGAFGWPVVLVNRDLVPGAVTTYLQTTRAAAVIVGGPGVVSNATQYALSRTVRTLP